MLQNITIPQGPHDLGCLEVTEVILALILLILIESNSDLLVNVRRGEILEKLLLLRLAVFSPRSLLSKLNLNKKH